MTTHKQIAVRPLNPDNEVEIQHLVSLFERSKESGVLSPAVFLPRFWKSAAGRRFTSIIALHEGKIVAHCGFGADRNSPSVATLTHCMFDMAAESHMTEIARGFEEILSAQLQRKGLSTVLTLRNSASEATETSETLEAFLRTLKLVPVAQLPDEKKSVEIWARLLNRGSSSLQFVPMEFRGAISSTYRSLGIRAVTRLSEDDGAEGVPADELAVEPFPVSRTGKAVIFITPSLLMQGKASSHWMPQPLEQVLRRWPRAAVAVKVVDPACEDMIRLLQSNGFTYLGLLPSFRGRDSMLFSSGNGVDSFVASHQPQHDAPLLSAPKLSAPKIFPIPAKRVSRAAP